MNEDEDQGTGEGMAKWQKCFDCGQVFHGAVFLALGWAGWKTYLGRPETDEIRCLAMGVLGGALHVSRPEEALPVLEASLALEQRHRLGGDHENILVAQSNVASCLSRLGRDDEALVIERMIYARSVATLGVSHEETIRNGNNLTVSLNMNGLLDEAKSFARDRLLPAARGSLGADHDLTLKISKSLATALVNHSERTRGDLRLNRHRSVVDATRFDLTTGDDLLEAETIMQDVVQRRRRVFGPAHPDTRKAEIALSQVREALARA